jgi:ATP/maltotriose-dependent transcriptional regulator MalT
VLGLQRLALLDTSAGQLDRGQRLVSEAFEVARASTSAQVRLHSFSRMNATLALNRFLAGDLDAARSAVTAASVVMEEAGECITCDSLIHPVAVPIHLAAGDVSAARHALRKTEATASSFRGHSRTATANHAAGLVLAAEGRWQEAERRLHQAAATFERLGQPYERARSDVALAAVRRMTGRSRDRVGDGTGTMQALGADPDPDRVARWLLPA